MSDDATTAILYRRPQWTGKPLIYSDGGIDVDFAECPCCLSHHAASLLACDGKRRDLGERCTAAVTPALQCERFADHLGGHDCIVEGHRVTWQPWCPAADDNGSNREQP